jgi:hypothetical protein
MTLLSREQILETDDRKYEVVECPEWGGAVRLRSITGAQRDSYEQSVMQTSGADRKLNLRNARAKLIVLCAVDADGRSMFTADDLGALGRKNAAPIDRLFDACRKLAGMSAEDVDKLTEDFGATPADDDVTSD